MAASALRQKPFQTMMKKAVMHNMRFDKSSARDGGPNLTPSAMDPYQIDHPHLHPSVHPLHD